MKVDLARIINLGPTYITQADVWVSSGDTLSLFKRRMANQEATGADKAFAYGTGKGAGGRSHFGAGARLSRTAQVRELART